MQLKLYKIAGHYTASPKQGIEFTAEAISFAQARAFVSAFIPNFRVHAIELVDIAASTHYEFALVNAAVSARFHLNNRRTLGWAVRAMAPTRRRTKTIHTRLTANA